MTNQFPDFLASLATKDGLGTQFLVNKIYVAIWEAGFWESLFLFWESQR